MPNSPLVLLGLVCAGGLGGWGCAQLRQWGPRNRWLALLLGLHLGWLGWLVILLAPRRED